LNKFDGRSNQPQTGAPEISAKCILRRLSLIHQRDEFRPANRLPIGLRGFAFAEAGLRQETVAQESVLSVADLELNAVRF
jgi:hypothetical protein